MKISHTNHDYLKLKKDPLEKYLSVFFSTNFPLNVAIFTFSMRSIFTFFTFQNRKNIKIRHCRNVTYMLYIIIKAKRKRLLQKFNQFKFSFCFFIFFNLVDEFGSYIYSEEKV